MGSSFHGQSKMTPVGCSQQVKKRPAKTHALWEIQDKPSCRTELTRASRALYISQGSNISALIPAQGNHSKRGVCHENEESRHATVSEHTSGADTLSTSETKTS